MKGLRRAGDSGFRVRREGGEGMSFVSIWTSFLSVSGVYWRVLDG